MQLIAVILAVPSLSSFLTSYTVGDGVSLLKLTLQLIAVIWAVMLAHIVIWCLLL